MEGLSDIINTVTEGYICNECKKVIPLSESSCTWTPVNDDLNQWDTDCGHSFRLDEGPPSSNNMEYCPFCGKILIEET